VGQKEKQIPNSHRPRFSIISINKTPFITTSQREKTRRFHTGRLFIGRKPAENTRKRTLADGERVERTFYGQPGLVRKAALGYLGATGSRNESMWRAVQPNED